MCLHVDCAMAVAELMSGLPIPSGLYCVSVLFFFSSRRRHTRCSRDWSSDVCSSDLIASRGPWFPRGRIAGRRLVGHGVSNCRSAAGGDAYPCSLRDLHVCSLERYESRDFYVLVPHRRPGG